MAGGLSGGAQENRVSSSMGFIEAETEYALMDSSLGLLCAVASPAPNAVNATRLVYNKSGKILIFILKMT